MFVCCLLLPVFTDLCLKAPTTVLSFVVDMALRRCLQLRPPTGVALQHAFQQDCCKLHLHHPLLGIVLLRGGQNPFSSSSSYSSSVLQSSPSFFCLLTHTDAFAGRSVGGFSAGGGGRNLNEGGIRVWPIAFEKQQMRRLSSLDAKTIEKKQSSGEKVVLYRAKWMQPLRLVVRLKIFQLCGVAALALPLAQYAEEAFCGPPVQGHKGRLSVGTLAAVAAVVGGAGAASAALWWFSRRYVGEMALFTPDLRIVQLSVIDFWGHRQDLKYDIRNIVPPLKGMSNAELEKAANQVLVPLDVVGERQFYLSLRHGRFLQKELLFQLLHGTLDLTNAQSFLNRQQMAPSGTQKVEVENDSHKEKSSIS